MRNLFITAAVAAFLSAMPAMAQDATPAQPISSTNSAPPLQVESEDDGWSFSLSGYQYFLPDGRDYFQPTFTADHKWLHLEARYNYEDLETASIWGGYNFSGGEELTWEFTPMIGAVFGDTGGIAPGYKGSLGWWKLELYSEGEYVFDSRESDDSFFYNWSELTLAPVDWLRFGMVTQRTKVYQTDREVQRGLLVGFNYRRVSFTTYVLNPDEGDPIWVAAIAVSF